MKKQILNPFLPAWEYIADAEAHVFGERVYVYGSHDMFGGEKSCMNNFVCWSAPANDLKSWRFEGEIYARTDDPANEDGARTLCAPDVCRGADGRYYMYYSLEGAGIISVAVCDKPAGRYAFYGYVHCADGHILSSREGEPYAFDPAVLRDEGNTYLYFGYCPYPPKQLTKVKKSYDYARVCRLADDMLTVSGEIKKAAPSFATSGGTGFEGHEFLAAASVRRIGDRYCLTYASRHGHELCYALADDPEGPFEFCGTIISNGDIGMDGITDEQDCNNYIGPNHGCLERIGNEWYVFYNRHTNRTGCARQTCAERVAPRPDGRIAQTEMTSCGLNGGPLAGKGLYPATMACVLKSRSGTMRGEVPLRGIHPYITQICADGNEESFAHIENFRRGAVCGFKYFAPAGATRIEAVVRGNGRGRLVASDGFATLATLKVEPSDTWTTLSAPFTTPGERFALFFLYTGDGATDILSFELK